MQCNHRLAPHISKGCFNKGWYSSIEMVKSVKNIVVNLPYDKN